MDAKSIRDYAKIMKEMELTALEISTNDGTTVRLERDIKQVVAAAPAAAAVLTTAAAANAVTVPQAVTVEPVKAAMSAAEAATATASQNKENANGLIPITSPMVGVFYSSPSENAAPFVSVGDRVKKGDVLCIIEAMKLMNEITAEEDGVIEEICVSNGQVVDFGHVMFRMSRA